MNDKLQSLIKAGTDNPKTSALAGGAVALYGAGEMMRAHMIEPWGSIVVGLAGVVVLITGWIARDPKGPPS